MTFLTFLWNGYCAIPLAPRTIVTVLAWFAITEVIALVCSAGTRADEAAQRDLDSISDRERFRRAFAAPAASRLPGQPLTLITSPGARDAGTCAPPGSGPGKFSERVASRRGVASRDALGVRPFRPGIAK